MGAQPKKSICDLAAIIEAALFFKVLTVARSIAVRDRDQVNICHRFRSGQIGEGGRVLFASIIRNLLSIELFGLCVDLSLFDLFSLFEFKDREEINEQICEVEESED